MSQSKRPGVNDHLLNSVQFRYHAEPGGQWHEIRAYFKGDPMLQGQPVGNLQWYETQPGQRHEIQGINVHEDLRRHGVATAMYNRAKEIDPKIAHSANRTTIGEGAGDLWARSTGDPLPANKRKRQPGD